LLLVLMAASQQGLFAKVRSNEMQPDWQVINETAGHGQGRQTGQIRTDRINVVQVHLNRVIDFFTELESG
jgi:hypothetical protein